ncbi:MAG: transporter, partial [Caproiciproducens sp.]|nr:transporter [Caproiciproducens sp.]
SFLNLGSTPVGNFLSGVVMENAGGDSGFVFCGSVTLLLLGLIFAVKRKSLLGWMSRTSTP